MIHDESEPPCLACGEYDNRHVIGCVLGDRADEPQSEFNCSYNHACGRADHAKLVSLGCEAVYNRMQMLPKCSEARRQCLLEWQALSHALYVRGQGDLLPQSCGFAEQPATHTNCDLDSAIYFAGAFLEPAKL